MKMLSMPPVVLVLLMAPAVALLAVACGAPAEEDAIPSAPASSPTASPSPSPTASERPSLAPEVSWGWIRTREYREWESPPGWRQRRTTTSPHGEAKVIYVDPSVAGAIGSGATRFPAGATIVKEGYDSGGKLAIVAVMQRLPRSGWLFAEYRSDGEIIEEAENPPLCTQCHTGGQDGVLAFSLD
jgi:hypothetical protein